MSKLELYVDNQRVELFKDEEITITQSIKKFQDVETVFTDYTQDFSVPASKENGKIFKHLHRGDVANSLDIRKRTSADILLNGILFKRGYVVFREAQVVNGKVNSYKLYFVGGLGHLKQKLGDIKINQLDYNIADKQNYDSVRDGLNRNRTATDGNGDLYDTLYSLITEDSGYYFSEVKDYPSNVDYPKNLSNTGYDNTNNVGGLNYQFLKPSIRMNAIVQAIERKFRNQGVIFSKDFFNTPIEDNPEWMSLFMLMHNEKGIIEADEQTNLKKVVLGTNFGTSVVDWQNQVGEVSVLGNNSSTQVFNSDTGIWTPTFSGNFYSSGILPFTMTDTIRFNLTSTNPSAKYSVYMRDVSNPNSEYKVLAKDITGTKNVQLKFNRNGEERFGKQRIYSFYVETDLYTNIGININVYYFGYSTPEYTELYATVGEEQSIDIPKLLPDIKVLDFLKGVFKLFNLVAYEDKYGTIVVQNYDSWREDRNTIDITKYVDDSEYGIDLKIPYNSLNFKYKDSEYSDKMFRNIPLGNISTTDYGALKEARIDITSSDNSFTSEIPFELLRYQRLFRSVDETVPVDELAWDRDTTIQIGQLVDDKGDGVKGKGIIYYPINTSTFTVSNSDALAINDGGSANDFESYYNIPSNTLYLRTDALPQPFTLSFGDYYDSWTRETVSNAGMYHTNHFNFTSPMFNTRNKGLKLDMYLPAHLLTSLELNDDIVFKNKKYRINSLKTNLQSGKSSIELFGYSTTDFSSVIDGLAIAEEGSPVITLTGDSTVNVVFGSTYTDLGATATDIEDGTVVVTDDSASIDTTSFATQTVRYDAVDSDGNSALPVFRTVVINTPALPTIDIWSTLSINQTTNIFEMSYTVSSVDVELKKVKFFVKLAGAADSPFDELSSIDLTGNYTYSGTFSSSGFNLTSYEVYMTVSTSGNVVRSSDLTITLT